MDSPPPPSYDQVIEELVRAEKAEGWPAACARAGRYLVVNAEFVAALAEQLRALPAGPILEICAGRGELARALSWRGVQLIATDADPPEGSSVIRAAAGEALRRYRPTTVIGCFVPYDAEVDQIVLDDPGVGYYLVLNARIDGQIGPAGLWTDRRWEAVALPEVSRWMICRHDVWVSAARPVLQHGEAWLLRRREREQEDTPR